MNSEQGTEKREEQAGVLAPHGEAEPTSVAGPLLGLVTGLTQAGFRISFEQDEPPVFPEAPWHLTVERVGAQDEAGTYHRATLQEAVEAAIADPSLQKAMRAEPTKGNLSDRTSGRAVRVKLTYFRAWGGGPGGLGGKYYTEGEFESEADPPSYWRAIDEAEKLRDEHRLPGLLEGPNQGSYHVLVTTDPESVPHLLVARHFVNPRSEAAPLHPADFHGRELREIDRGVADTGAPAAVRDAHRLTPGARWAVERLRVLDASAKFSLRRGPARQVIEQIQSGYPVEEIMAELAIDSLCYSADLCRMRDSMCVRAVLGAAIYRDACVPSAAPPRAPLRIHEVVGATPDPDRDYGESPPY